MIEGLKVTVTGQELMKLADDCAKNHQVRSQEYGAQIESFKESNVAAMNYTGGDPVRELQNRKERHDDEAQELKFIADHIELEERYLLDMTDLWKLGIVKRTF